MADTPGDLEAALAKKPGVKAFFEKLSPSHRQKYVRWIADAKKPETRANRVAKTLEMLGEKQRGR